MPLAMIASACRFRANGASPFVSALLTAMVAVSALLSLSRGQCLSYACFKQCRDSGRGPGKCLSHYHNSVRYMGCACSDTIDYHLADEQYFGTLEV
ncbi:hypothetical protein HPB52_002737 [Rhipicephalus sanguineus]|uniref:Uncharacterized protein n=1 Tax=Rhipicephalus sanguineus TaxID=34632 RepID=A0A9D4PIP1_RHISA|nr:hypothetical protein HPB52_002737 [Rhipicephalus sanguineus]